MQQLLPRLKLDTEQPTLPPLQKLRHIISLYKRLSLSSWVDKEGKEDQLGLSLEMLVESQPNCSP